MRNIDKWILIACLGIAATPALARGHGDGYGGASTQDAAAQFPDQWRYAAAEQRTDRRERRQSAPQQQREQSREQLREEWQNMPPEERQRHRQEWLKRLRQSGDDQADEGYGSGYGSHR